MLIPHSILPNHTEGHQLNGRDVLSRKAGLRLGKDSTGVEEYPNQDKERKFIERKTETSEHKDIRLAKRRIKKNLKSKTILKEH